MQNSFEDRAYAVVGYMVTSAANLLDEPRAYGPLRLVEAASRLIALLEQEEMASARLSALRQRMEAGSSTVQQGEQEFRAFLDLVVDELVGGFDQ